MYPPFSKTIVFPSVEGTFMSKSVYEELAPVTFEGKSYLAVEQLDYYLTRIFGDYLQLPPVEKRVSHHAYDSYLEA